MRSSFLAPVQKHIPETHHLGGVTLRRGFSARNRICRNTTRPGTCTNSFQSAGKKAGSRNLLPLFHSKRICNNIARNSVCTTAAIATLTHVRRNRHLFAGTAASHITAFTRGTFCQPNLSHQFALLAGQTNLQHIGLRIAIITFLLLPLLRGAVPRHLTVRGTVRGAIIIV
mmetsp:Transcript_35029/g.89501  ORF Transcript_35029/g.89501 Transcript_35029/m.89501 type:complete len:171 (+) Transcript_35029:1381-1893(+)